MIADQHDEDRQGRDGDGPHDPAGDRRRGEGQDRNTYPDCQSRPTERLNPALLFSIGSGRRGEATGLGLPAGAFATGRTCLVPTAASAIEPSVVQSEHVSRCLAFCARRCTTGAMVGGERSVDPERARLAAAQPGASPGREQGAERSEPGIPWHRWGPYLAERQWATVREDYSPDGSCLGLLSARPRPLPRLSLGRGRPARVLRRPDAALLRAGAVERADPILKERLFGLTGHEGNHGEDVKEYYYYLDATPTHSYMRDALQVSAGAISLRRAGRRKPAPRPTGSRSSSCSTPASSTTTATSTCSSNTPRRRRRHPDPDHAPPTAGRSRRRCTCADALVSQHLGLGPSTTSGRELRAVGEHGARSQARASATLGDYWLAALRRRAAACCSPTTTPTSRGCGAAERRRTSRTASTTAIVTDDPTAVNPEPSRHESGARTIGCDASAQARPHRCSAAPVDEAARADPFADFDARLRAAPSRGRRSSTPALRRRAPDRADAPACSARPSPGCSGPSSSTTTTSADWLDGDPAEPAAARAAMHRPQSRLAASQQRRRASRCPTSGSIRGSRPGTWRSTASRWR